MLLTMGVWLLISMGTKSSCEDTWISILCGLISAWFLPGSVPIDFGGAFCAKRNSRATMAISTLIFQEKSRRVAWNNETFYSFLLRTLMICCFLCKLRQKGVGISKSLSLLCLLNLDKTSEWNWAGNFWARNSAYVGVICLCIGFVDLYEITLNTHTSFIVCFPLNIKLQSLNEF